MSWTYPGPPPRTEGQITLDGLSARLATVADLARTSLALADVGTDHARLLVAMVRHGWAPAAIGVDRAEAPLRSARKTLGSSSIRIELRKGEGLAPLRPGEIDTVVVAGVGGRTAVEILDAERLGALDVRRVVVQPNRDDAHVRRHLTAHRWRISTEKIVYDSGRIFYALAAEPGASVLRDPVDVWIGPVLRAAKGPLVDAYCQLRREWLRQRPPPRGEEIETVLRYLDSR